MTTSEPLRRSERSRHVRDLLRSDLRDHELPWTLPDEDALADALGVSRNAVREALVSLREQGLVERRRGIGTFAAQRPVAHRIDRLCGLTESLRVSLGAPVENAVLTADLVRGPLAVLAALGATSGEAVVMVERLRTVQNRPVSLDTSYFHAGLAHGLLDCDLEHHDLLTLIENDLALSLGTADVIVEAAGADASLAAQLRVKAGAPVLHVDRVVRLEDGSVLAVEYLRMRSDRIALTGRSISEQDGKHA